MGQEESAPSLPPETVHLSLCRLKLTKIPFFIPNSHPVINIDASHNYLKTFPTSLDNLESLDLTDNNLSTLEDHFDTAKFEFKRLKKLKLSSNKLKKLPSSLATLPSLAELSLDRNELTDSSEAVIPNSVISLDLFLNSFTEFPKLPNSVKYVNVGFNQIKSLSIYLPNLTELRLPGNDLTEITEECKFDSVVFLDLSFNRLVSLPPVRDFAPKAETFIFSFNFLSEFPTDFPTSTKKIEISHNCISQWSHSLTDLTELTILDVSFNHFTSIPSLPPKIDKFIADHNFLTDAVPIQQLGLKGLQLNHNSFQQIPSFNESKATHLLIRHNNLESIKVDAISPDIRSIDLTCNKIKELPIELFLNFKCLSTLMLTKNQITSIPKDIVNSKIQTLMISDNPITELPQLPDSLKEITVCNCEITELPECLYTLSEIQMINFNCNKIEHIEKFPEVESLNLSQNLLTKIPPLPDFVSYVDLSHNLLIEFSFDGGDFPFLQFLDLSHNSLTKLQLRPLPSLQVFKISHNKVSFKLDLTMFPKLDTVDLHQTDVKLSMPIPFSVREIISNEIKSLKSGSTQLKFFKGKRCGYCETIGSRPTMEDSLIIWESSKPKTPSLYGVIDGHGGFRTSAMAASLIPSFFEKLETKSISGISTVFKQVNEVLSKMEVTDGATIVLATVTPTLVSVAHLGDARAIVVRNDGSVYPLTFDHKPTERSELDVLKETRAFVASGRLSSHLAVSRALGDFLIDGVSRMPDLSTYNITDSDSWLVLACDGVFDVLENGEVGEIVAKCGDMHRAAATVKNEAIIRGSTDNVSVIVIDISKQKK